MPVLRCDLVVEDRMKGVQDGDTKNGFELHGGISYTVLLYHIIFASTMGCVLLYIV
jgi:hypothetical protein